MMMHRQQHVAVTEVRLLCTLSFCRRRSSVLTRLWRAVCSAPRTPSTRAPTRPFVTRRNSSRCCLTSTSPRSSERRLQGNLWLHVRAAAASLMPCISHSTNARHDARTRPLNAMLASRSQRSASQCVQFNAAVDRVGGDWRASVRCAVRGCRRDSGAVDSGNGDVGDRSRAHSAVVGRRRCKQLAHGRVCACGVALPRRGLAPEGSGCASTCGVEQ